MNLKKRIISFLLVICTIVMAFSSALSLMTFAEEEEEEKKDIDEIVGEYLKKEFNTPEEKLATMTKRLSKNGYELYVDELTGEVATKNKKTGEIMFSNPYDVATEGKVTSDSTIPRLLSQVLVTFSDSSGEIKTFNSFDEAAKRGQIVVKNIKNGIRVEYAIGRTESRYLVPRRITQERYEELILGPLYEATFGENPTIKKFDYEKYFGDPVTSIYKLKKEGDKLYPITDKVGPIYVCDASKAKELTKIEQFVKAYCTEYSYEELEKDNAMCEYVPEDKNPPLFRVALEYTLNEDGLSVTLPASGIRFNQSLYTLENLTILPYMGCGEYSLYSPNDGYIFFPDGSGTLFDYSELKDDTSNLSISGMVYGEDFAYQTLKGTAYEETIRYPVFGIAERQNKGKVNEDVITEIEEGNRRGFVAIITEGDSMAELIASSGGTTHSYYNVEMRVYPRPKDTYILSDAVSVGSNNEWTVTSSRKYTGNYTIKYIMLTDDKVAEENNLDSYYTTDWIGMANAYRDYLLKNDVLKKLSASEVEKDIPLYIESFGAIETTEKFLAFPVNVMTALTTFEDIKEMYETLKTYGIKNVNFRLTGFANGGMYYKVPYNLKWENSVGGSKGFKELMEYVDEVNKSGEGHIGIYPDFDFAYVKDTGLFDGYSAKDHAIKTIDNRYTSKRYYSETKQTYITYFELAISASVFDHFYEKLTKNYQEYSIIGDGSDLGISVASIGTDLNSDFDEDEPYNREDSKEYTVKAFDYLDKHYGSVMTDGANAYTWKYIDHILNAPLTSSRYFKSACTVPFLGTVLHGCIQFAGTPINMEGNVKYATLKAIESGSNPYFTLSYRNTDVLKEDSMLSKYYSTRYNIWVGETNDDGVFEKGDLLDIYGTLNEALKSVQTSNIIGHSFLNGRRIASAEELALDLESKTENAKASYEEFLLQIESELKKYTGEAFVLPIETLEGLKSISMQSIINAKEILGKNSDDFDKFEITAIDFRNAISRYQSDAKKALEAYKTALGVINAYNLVNSGDYTYSNEIVSEISEKYTVALEVASLYEEYYKAYIDANEKVLNFVDTKTVDSKYIVSDYSIVEVVYGEGKTAEKTFVLNYNYFDVEVEIDGKTFTVKAYDFIEVK